MYRTQLMKICLLLFLSLLFACKQSSNSTDNEARVLLHEDTLPFSPKKTKVQQEQPTSVEDIQLAYKEIIASYEKGTLDSTSFKYNCNGEKSGTVTYFSAQGKLKMIKHNYNEYDHHEMLDQYYVFENTLFFAHLKSLSWSFDSGPEGSTKDRITEKRIYLSAKSPIKCLEKQYEIRLHAGVNPNPESVPNKEVACTLTKSTIEKPFKLLTKYWKASPPNCLNE